MVAQVCLEGFAAGVVLEAVALSRHEAGLRDKEEMGSPELRLIAGNCLRVLQFPSPALHTSLHLVCSQI